MAAQRQHIRGRQRGMAAQIVLDLGCEPPEVEITSGALDDKSGLRVSVLSRDLSHDLIGRKRRENTHAGRISREQRIREYVYMVIGNRHAALTYCSAAETLAALAAQ